MFVRARVCVCVPVSTCVLVDGFARWRSDLEGESVDGSYTVVCSRL